MFKLFEWIGTFLAILMLMEMLHIPKQAIRDIRNGPAPRLGVYARTLK